MDSSQISDIVGELGSGFMANGVGVEQACPAGGGTVTAS
jgi:hypothetical protein